MREITPADLQRLITKKHTDKLSPKTIRNVWGVVSLTWQAALTYGYVAAVLPKPKLPKPDDDPERCFTEDEVAKITSAGEPRVFYWLLAETGVRAGETCRAELSDVKGDSLSVTRAVWNGKEQSPKTKNSRRTLVMSPQLHGNHGSAK